MAPQSPLNPLHQQAEASFLSYGDLTTTDASGATRSEAAMVVETFGELEGEYAALRRGCILLDLPQRGTLRITGADRLDFLNRMVTQDLKGMKPYEVRNAFWLNRKGRIEADLRLIELGSEMWVDLDVHSAASSAASLSNFLFSEAVEITDATRRMHRLALHGGASWKLLQAISEPIAGPMVTGLTPGDATEVRIAGHRVIVDRADPTGEPGLHMLMDVDHASAVYEQLLERGIDHNGAVTGVGRLSAGPPQSFRMRPAGWHAYNIARLEAGTPIFHIDFGTNSLPAETGILNDRVSFTKGCYLGQEVVARMHSLGHPKQTLVGLRVEPDEEQLASGRETQPIGGSIVLIDHETERTAVGAVTSSTRSPMLGDSIIAFAQVRWEHREPGTVLRVETDAGPVRAVVQESLKFWSKPK